MTHRLSLCLVLLAAVPAVAAPPEWVKPMQDVHAQFKGTPGTLALFGDSITVSMAFWSPLQYEPKGMSDEMKAALAVVKKHMKADSWSKWRGPKYGNNGGETIRWARQNV